MHQLKTISMFIAVVFSFIKESSSGFIVGAYTTIAWVNTFDDLFVECLPVSLLENAEYIN